MVRCILDMKMMYLRVVVLLISLYGCLLCVIVLLILLVIVFWSSLLSMKVCCMNWSLLREFLMVGLMV